MNKKSSIASLLATAVLVSGVIGAGSVSATPCFLAKGQGIFNGGPHNPIVGKDGNKFFIGLGLLGALTIAGAAAYRFRKGNSSTTENPGEAIIPASFSIAVPPSVLENNSETEETVKNEELSR